MAAFASFCTIAKSWNPGGTGDDDNNNISLGVGNCWAAAAVTHTQLDGGILVILW